MLNHFTVPASSTAVSVDGAFNVVDWKFDRPDAVGAAVLRSTLSTSVTCGPLCPGPTRTSRVSPSCTALIPPWVSTLPWRKASPDPSESSTNPKPLSGLNHLTTPLTDGPEGASEGCSAKAGSGSVSTGLWVVGIGVEIATPRMTKILLSHFGSWGWIGSIPGRRLDSIAGLIAGVLDTGRRWFDVQVALQTAWIKRNGSRPGLALSLVLFGCSLIAIKRWPSYFVTASDAAWLRSSVSAHPPAPDTRRQRSRSCNRRTTGRRRPLQGWHLQKRWTPHH
jgi:hypothetical protein